MKPGYKTTEFYVVMCVVALSVCVTGAVLCPGEMLSYLASWERVLLAVVGVMGAVGSAIKYSEGRASEKTAHALPAPEVFLEDIPADDDDEDDYDDADAWKRR